MTVRMLSDAALRRRIGRCRELDELVSNRYERNATRLHDFYQMIAAGEIFDDPDVGWREWKLGRHGHWLQTIDDMKTTYLGELVGDNHLDRHRQASWPPPPAVGRA